MLPFENITWMSLFVCLFISFPKSKIDYKITLIISRAKNRRRTSMQSASLVQPLGRSVLLGFDFLVIRSRVRSRVSSMVMIIKERRITL